jgi:hypothetical protein
MSVEELFVEHIASNLYKLRVNSLVFYNCVPLWNRPQVAYR